MITRDVDLNDLIGQEFEVQGVRFLEWRNAGPATGWTAIRPGTQEFLKGRGGLRAKILTDGEIVFDGLVIPREVEESSRVSLMMPRDSSLRFAQFGITLVRCCLRAANRAVWARIKRPFFFAENRSGKFNSKRCSRLDPQKFFSRQESDPSWRPDDVQFIADVPPSCGPLSGLAASWLKVRTAHLLALAIDMPLMTDNYLEFPLRSDRAGSGRRSEDRDRGVDRSAAIYPREAAIEFREALVGTDFSLQTVTRRRSRSGKLGKYVCTEEDQTLFLNVNELSDIRR